MAYYLNPELDFHEAFFQAGIQEGDRVYEKYGLHMRLELYCNGWELQ